MSIDTDPNIYHGEHCGELFNALVAEVRFLILENSMTTFHFEMKNVHNRNVCRCFYEMRDIFPSPPSLIVILHDTEQNNLIVRNQCWSRNQIDIIPDFLFPLNNAFVQRNLQLCFRRWIRECITYPSSTREERFNAFIDAETRREAHVNESRLALLHKGIPVDVFDKHISKFL